MREILVIEDEEVAVSARPVVEAFPDDRLRLIRTRGTGPATKRNRGIEIADGDLLAFLDDDDVWLPGKLDRQVRRLKENRDAGVVYCRHSRIRDQRILTDPFPLHEGRVLERLLAGWVPPITSSTVVRRDVLSEVRYRPALDGLEDYDLWLQLAEVTEFVAVDEVLTLIDQTGSGHMTQAVPARDLALRDFKTTWMPAAVKHRVGQEFEATCDHLAWTNAVTEVARKRWTRSMGERMRILFWGLRSPASRSSVPAVAVRLAVGERLYWNVVLPVVDRVQGTPVSAHAPWVSLTATI